MPRSPRAIGCRYASLVLPGLQVAAEPMAREPRVMWIMDWWTKSGNASPRTSCGSPDQPGQHRGAWTGPKDRRPSGFSLELRPHTESELPYYKLRDYKLDWRVVDDKGVPLTGGESHFVELSEAMRIAGRFLRARRHRPCD